MSEEVARDEGFQEGVTKAKKQVAKILVEMDKEIDDLEKNESVGWLAKEDAIINALSKLREWLNE